MRELRSIIVLLAILALAGCKREDVKVYHVPKDDSSSLNQITAPDQSSAARPQQPQLQWTLPGGWREIAPSQMRVASFTVTDTNGEIADVGVIPLPTGKNELALVNMWREQMQLSALTNETTAETISIGNDSAKLFDIASDALLIDGKFRARILIAELRRGATSWFFKMTGEDSFVAVQKENFLQFLKSVSFAGNTPTQNAGEPPAQNESNKSIWTIPPGWQPVDPGTMLFAKFSISSGDTKAEVNISSLTGDGGGVLANVNRWRGQLGLNSLNEMELAHLHPIVNLPDGGRLTLVDFTGTDAKTGQPARLTGIVVPQNGQTWFYKLMGDETVVGQQKDAFIKFVQSANYANARNAP